MGKNNVIPNNHFKKKWQVRQLGCRSCRQAISGRQCQHWAELLLPVLQFYVKTWFNQPARKTRRQNGEAQAASMAHTCQA